MKRLRIELSNLKSSDGRIIALPTVVIAINTTEQEFGFSAICLWYNFSITYYYGRDLDC